MAAQHDPVDRVAEIERLAALDPIDYDAGRVAAAERMSVRASVLDREVAKKRRALGLDTDENDGQGRAVKIIDVLPWPDPVDGDYLASALVAAVKVYAVVSDEVADAIALWVLHTWVVNMFTVSPRLAVTSPTKGCGKTTILRILNMFARRAKRAGSISPSALFRAVEQFQPTVVLDETEKYIEHGSDLHALLNEGHCKGAMVWRVLGDKLELREFGIFGAAAFARNGRLPDDLEQRSIIIEMQRRLPGEPLSELREDRCKSLRRIARMCARWADDVHLDDYCDPNMVGLINRDADNWRPLFAIADAIGSDWPERARKSAVALAPGESHSTNTMLLSDIKATFEEKAVDRLASIEICEALTAMEGRPWAEWKTNKGAPPKPISQNQLARLLKDFHIRPDNIYPGGGKANAKRPKGYLREQFYEVWQRYLAPEGVNEPLHRYNATAAGTSAHFPSATPEPDVAFQKCEKPPSDGHCSGVASQGAGKGPPSHEG